eukprot:4435569-Pyramimonas_sp.AAC.3
MWSSRSPSCIGSMMRRSPFSPHPAGTNRRRDKRIYTRGGDQSRACKQSASSSPGGGSTTH